MDTDVEIIRDFIAHMGIDAEVKLDSNNQKLIIMGTEQFNLRRAWVETWFTLVDEVGEYSYFRERERGTGQTL
jgi:hypothetical protein